MLMRYVNTADGMVCFFVKQKVAYEERIGDCSSDVCADDLGAGKGVAASCIKALEKLAIDHHRPDLTLLLDIDPEEGLRRARARGDENRFEQETLAFMHKVSDGFLDRKSTRLNSSH